VWEDDKLSKFDKENLLAKTRKTKQKYIKITNNASST
jgi:hypothetical protein